MKKIDNVIDYLESLKLYRQERVIRWQQRDYIFPENDASHQLFVTQIIIVLCNLFHVSEEDMLKALAYGCVHDYVESADESLGDINYMLKAKNPDLKKMVEDAELAAIKKVPEFYKTFQNCKKSFIASTIVDLADSLEALLYCRREVAFNKQTEEWEQIINELLPRIYNLAEELKEKLELKIN